MKTQFKGVIASLFVLITFQLPAREVRTSAYINSEWKFVAGDVQGAEMPSFNDSDWTTVGIPHSFSIPYFMSEDFYTGYGWYRKRIRFEKKDLADRWYIEFEGVFQDAEVYLNGELAGHHVGGYTGFCIDVTDHVICGENVLAVRVNNLWRPDVAPRAGEHVFSGGIYRNVRLIRKAQTHIVWNGITILTPDLAENRGLSSSVQVKAVIRNYSSDRSTFSLVSTVYDPDDHEVTSVRRYFSIEAGCQLEKTLTTPEIEKPDLWSPDTPSLYRLETSLYVKGKLLDRISQDFGFRWFDWTADKGFFMNGKHLYLRGANVHQDQAGWGDAVTDASAARDVRMMKEAGFNFIRGSHYPHSPAFVRACDRLGILFWSEAPFWGIGGFEADGYWNSSAYPVNPQHQEAFEKSVLDQLQEMIMIHKNSPSVICWSMCNEVFFSAPQAMSGVRHLLSRMVELTHRTDPTRPAAIGGSQRPLGDMRIDTLGDVAGYNGDGARIPDFQHPAIPTLVSEYGSVTCDRPGEYSPGWGVLAANDGWKGFEWRSGQAVWCGFDHGSIAGSTLGKMGIVDYFRIPKRAWYWYRNEYAGIPCPEWPVTGIPAALELTADHSGLQSHGKDSIAADGTDDVLLRVSVKDEHGTYLSNSPVTKLEIVSGPGEFPTGRSITFAPDSDIRIMDGQAAITLRSYQSGRTIVRAVSEGLAPAEIELEFKGGDRFCPATSVIGDRPYRRFVSNRTKGPVVFGPGNPVFTSSMSEGHPSGFAADDDSSTFWVADPKDVRPVLTLDTEKKLVLRGISLSFPDASRRALRIEASSDGKEWKTVVNLTGRKALEQDEFHQNISLWNCYMEGRFVRVVFLDGSPAVTDIKVSGTVCR